MYLFSLSLDSMTYNVFKLYYSSHIVECSVAFERSDLSKAFWQNLQFTSKFASRDLVFYIKPMRRDYYDCEGYIIVIKVI